MRPRSIACGLAVAAAATISVTGAGAASAAPSADLVATGAGFGVSIKVTNNGPAAATNVVVYPQNVASLLIGRLPKFLGTIEPGASQIVTYGLPITLPGNQAQAFTVVSTTGDPDRSNNTVVYNY